MKKKRKAMCRRLSVEENNSPHGKLLFDDDSSFFCLKKVPNPEHQIHGDTGGNEEESISSSLFALVEEFQRGNTKRGMRKYRRKETKTGEREEFNKRILGDSSNQLTIDPQLRCLIH
jgi:hypothetical protein